MINVLYGDLKCEILPKQLETFDKYSKILQWGRQNPTRFIEQFIGIQLTDYQKYVILSSWIPSNVVWVCSRSSGKAEVLDTPVYKQDCNGNYNKILLKDLKVGDRILGADGKSTEVIHMNPIIIDDVYEIEFEDGEKIKCNKEHLWVVKDCVKDNWLNRYERIKRTVSTEDLYNTRVFTSDKYRYQIPLIKPIQHKKKKYIIEPYLLGLWLGDGTSDGPIITCEEKDVLEEKEILESLNENGWKFEIKQDKNETRKCFRIYIRHDKDFINKDGKVQRSEFCDRLRELGVFKNKHVPLQYKNGSPEQRRDLLCGLYDSDGSCQSNGRQVFSQKNTILANDVKQVLDELGIKNSIHFKSQHDKRTNKTYSSYMIYSSANSKSNPLFKLKRKLERQEKLKLEGIDKNIVRITKMNKKEAMRCITVDNKDGLFVCGDKYTVTHNSFMSAPLIMARSLLIPSHNTYIMGPTGSQSQETFTKLENLAKNNIASVVGVTSFFLDECVRINSKADPFTHDKSGYTVELYNGSTINTLNSVAKNVVGIRSSLNIYDEAGKIDRDFFALTLPFTVQNADFRLGGTLNTDIYPRQLQNKNLLCSSAEGIDSELYDRYKIAFTKMLMGDPEYFVCDLDCTHSLHPFLNGKPTKPLITQQTIDDAYNTNPYRCMREYWNKFDNDLTKSALYESIKCISLNCQKALRVLYTTT